MILDDGNVRLEIVGETAELLDMRATYRPGSKPPPLHYHPRQEERFEVQKGALWFSVGGVPRVLAAGESVVVPAGAVHQARNARSDEEAVVIWQTRPAQRSGDFFRAVYELSKRGRSLLGMAAVAREFRNEFVLAKPPRLVQTCLFGMLAPLARLLGWERVVRSATSRERR